MHYYQRGGFPGNFEMLVKPTTIIKMLMRVYIKQILRNKNRVYL